MRTRVSSKGQIVLPAALRNRDGVLPGQEFEIERLGRGEYVLKRARPRSSDGLVDWLLNCPEKGWFQPLDVTETTDRIKPPKFK